MVAAHKPIKYFVTRHDGAVRWAARSGLKARKVEMTNFDVSVVKPGDVVMGTLPVHLAAEVCKRGGHYWHLALEIPPDRRGHELTAEDMRAFGARLEEVELSNLGARVSSTTDAAEPGSAYGRPVLHLCIATGETLANLLPLQQLAWDRVVILRTPEMSERARHLEALVREIATRRGGSGDAVVEYIDMPSDTLMVDIEATFWRIAEDLQVRYPDHDWVANISGGTKPMTLAAYRAMRPHAKLLYCDTRQDRIEVIHPPGEVPQAVPPDLLDLDLLLHAQGYVVRDKRSVSAADISPLTQRIKVTATLALGGDARRVRMSGDSPGNLGRPLVAILHELASNSRARTRADGVVISPFAPVQVLHGVAPDELSPGVLKLLDCMVDTGLLRDWRRPADGSRVEIEITSDEAAAFLAGGYLEEYVLLCAIDLGLQPSQFAGNVRIDVIDPSPNRIGSDMNELDLALVWRNRLLIVECKAGRVLYERGAPQTVVNKLAALRNAAGPFGSLWLASRAFLNIQLNADLIDRMKLHRVEGVSGEDELRSLPKKLAAWCGAGVNAPGIDWKSLIVPNAAPKKRKSGGPPSKRT